MSLNEFDYQHIYTIMQSDKIFLIKKIVYIYINQLL